MWRAGGEVQSADFSGRRTAPDLVAWVFDAGRTQALADLAREAHTPPPPPPPSGTGGEGADYYVGTGVVPLTATTYMTEVQASADVWLVEFYAPWCAHCRALKPAYIEAAARLKAHGVRVGALDCMAHQPVCAEAGVTSYPAIKRYGSDKELTPEDYTGPRTAASLVDFGVDGTGREHGFYRGSDVVGLSPAAFRHQVLEGAEPWLVKFYAPWCGHCADLKPDYAAAATALKGVAHLGAVDCSVSAALCRELGIPGYPTLKLYAGPNRGDPTEFGGERSLAGLTRFVQEHVLGLYAASDVEVLDAAAWEARVAGGSDPWMVKFYAPWCAHCRDMSAEWKLLGEHMKYEGGRVRVGAVDCAQSHELCARAGVAAYPTLLWFGPDRAAVPERYEGPRKASPLASWALQRLEELAAGQEHYEYAYDEEGNPLLGGGDGGGDDYGGDGGHSAYEGRDEL